MTKIIKIGIRHNYCCKEDFFEIYYIFEKNIDDRMKHLLMEYTNNYDLDIMLDNPFYDLLKNNIKYEEGNENDYNCCDYKLYSQDC